MSTSASKYSFDVILHLHLYNIRIKTTYFLIGEFERYWSDPNINAPSLINVPQSVLQHYQRLLRQSELRW